MGLMTLMGSVGQLSGSAGVLKGGGSGFEGGGVVSDFYFGSLFHFDMFVDILVDDCLFLLLLPFFDLSQVLFLVAEHILLEVDVVLAQQLHQLAAIMPEIGGLRLEQHQLAIDDRGLVVDLVEGRMGGLGELRLAVAAAGLLVEVRLDMSMRVDVFAAEFLREGELDAEGLHDLVLLSLRLEQLVREGITGCFVFLFFSHRRISKRNLQSSLQTTSDDFDCKKGWLLKLFRCNYPLTLLSVMININQRVKMQCKLTRAYFLLIVALLCVHTLSLEEKDDDRDVIQPDSSTSFEEDVSWSGFEVGHANHGISQQEQTLMQKEIDELIGIHEVTTDEQGNAPKVADLTNLKRILDNNQKWASSKLQIDPEYFKKHHLTQKPTYLWIGCSDSRLPANEILGLDYGEVFVLRNVANTVSPSDISALAVIQYAVEVLQVKDIIVAGHYGCGGVKAAVRKFNHGPLEAWLSKLRRIRHKHAQAFSHLSSTQQKARLLVEINVKEQVFNVASTPFVQKAWKEGQELRVHGVVFDMKTGRLVDLHLTMHSIEQLPDELVVFE